MEIVVHGMDLRLSERIKEYAQKKLAKLDRYLPNIVEARIELRQEKNRNKEQPVAELTVRNSRGVILRSEEKKQQDVHAAVDSVVDKMYRQIERYKGKTKRRKINDPDPRWLEPQTDWDQVEEVPLADHVDYDELPKLEIVKRKSVLLTPMSEQEAIDQMELLGHSFFLFYNGQEDTINVLYRRDDGQYGLLTPRVD
jgi:putative sigma-54 modulation protein